MTTETELIAAFLSNPADYNALLVYADFLQEQGSERAREEEEIRAEAKRLQDGGTAITTDKVYDALHDGLSFDPNQWKRCHEWYISRAVAASVQCRVKVKDSKYPILYLELIDHAPIRIDVFTNTYRPVRPTCSVQVGYINDSKHFVYGARNGFNVNAIVAEVQRQVAIHNRRTEFESTRKQREDALQEQVQTIRAAYNLAEKDNASLIATHGDLLSLRLTLPPADMQSAIALLAQHGYIR